VVVALTPAVVSPPLAGRSAGRGAPVAGATAPTPGCTECVVASIDVGTAPAGVAYAEGLGEVAVANFRSNNVSVISDGSNRVVATVPASAAEGIAYDSGTSQFFVTDYNYGSGGTVTVISGTTDAVVRTIPVGVDPWGVVDDSADGEVFVMDYSNATGGNVSVINTTTDAVVATVPTGLGPGAAALDPVTGELYVADYNANAITVIAPATDQVVRTIPVGEGPDSVAYDPANGDLYVANDAGTNLTLISGSTEKVVGSIPLHPSNCGPSGLAYDPSSGALYAGIVCGTSHGAVLDNVSVITGASNTVVASIPVGINPTGLAYDAARGFVYATNSYSGNVSVIQADRPSTGGSGTFLGLPGSDGWLLIGALAAASVGVGAWVVVRRARRPPRTGGAPGMPPATGT